MHFPVAERAALTFCSKVGELGRGPRSCPFATLIGASERARKVRQNAPTSVSNGHDLTLLPSSPAFEQKVCSPETAQFGKHNTQLLNALKPGQSELTPRSKNVVKTGRKNSTATNKTGGTTEDGRVQT